MDAAALGYRVNVHDIDGVVMTLAQESSGDAPLMTKVMSYAEFLTTALVVITNAGVWWISAVLHRDETRKRSEETRELANHLADANDNITDVALAEIDAHHRNTWRMRELRQQRRRTISNTRRVVRPTTRKDLS